MPKTIRNRQYSYTHFNERLVERYGLLPLAREEYDKMCAACRGIRYEIKSQVPIEGTDSHQWIMVPVIQGKKVYVVYETPRDAVTTCLPPEHFDRREEE